jgi:hypothetical protein
MPRRVPRVLHGVRADAGRALRGLPRRALTLAMLGVAVGLGACSADRQPQRPYGAIIPPDIPAPKLVDERANGATVTVQRTQWLLVKLAIQENGPWRWTFEIDGDRNVYPSGVTPRYETDAAGVRNEILTFRGESAGKAGLRFAYRNFEAPQLPPARIVAFDVIVH